ncbi:hypothetical protein ISG33_00550 [Glaciecola sp. MH2013]|nr:hypothetical protein [Glaciecola sp. MH2013]
MQNHTHLVLFVDDSRAETLSNIEVLRRWGAIHKLTAEETHYLRYGEEGLTDLGRASVKKEIMRRRKSLSCISTFMKELNQEIATRANKEDDCKGKFWEARFKSQALLDEKALIACMVYVELNPLRVGASSSLSNSEYTSIRKRLIEARIGKQPFELLPFKTKREQFGKHLPFDLFSYLELVEQTSKTIGTSGKNVASFSLAKFGIAPSAWEELCIGFEEAFGFVAGNADSLIAFKNRINQKRIKGVGNATRLFP